MSQLSLSHDGHPERLLELLRFYLCGTPEEAGSNTSEGMPQQEGPSPARVRASRQRAKASFFPVLSCGPPPEGAFPPQMTQQENPTQACPAAGILADSRCCQVDAQDWPWQWQTGDRERTAYKCLSFQHMGLGSSVLATSTFTC